MNLNKPIEKVYNKCMAEIDGMRIISDRHSVELTDDHFRVGINVHRHRDLMISIQKKCSFSGFYLQENSFVWHLNTDADLEILLDRIKKIPASTMKSGPYDFSKRSTYIKRIQKVPQAMSGNYVSRARVDKVVVIGDKGKLLDDLSVPGGDPWFRITTWREGTSYGCGSYSILYNMDQWWPVRLESDSLYSGQGDMHATSVLVDTDGKLLTMHDKFVLDLAVKIFNEDRKDDKTSD